MPKTGVYAALAFIDGGGDGTPAMVNIGYRPTFEGTPRESTHLTVEANIIGMTDELYGKDVRLEFLGRLRDEKRFETVDELKTQLALDREDTLSMINDITFR